MVAFVKLLLLVVFSFLGVITAYSSEFEDETKLRGRVWYGNASWYGSRFHGKKTSSGEKYNKRSLTAAHRYLPFNTKVLVTNLSNNESVIVRINDRGPFVDNRIIDLSEKAAERINLKKMGTAYIKLQVVSSRI